MVTDDLGLATFDYLFAADRQPLATLGATALEDQTAVLAGHTDQKSMRLTTTARIRLKRALTLHDLSGGPLDPVGAQLFRNSIVPSSATCN